MTTTPTFGKAHHLTVGVNHDHLSGLAKCHPAVGIAELVWNALDADATEVKVWLRDGSDRAIRSVEVNDNGTGIDITRVDDAFQNLGGSWKTTKKTSAAGRVLHGRSGKGRFRAGSIGRVCRWNTVNRALDGTVHSFSVVLNTDDLKDVEVGAFSTELSNAETGTRVVIQDVHVPHSKAFDPDTLRQRLVEEFGPYLLQYPKVLIAVDGERLDPKPLISDQRAEDLAAVQLVDGRSVDLHVRMVEWKSPAERRIFLCDNTGTTLADVPMRSHLLDGYVTAYVHSSEFERAKIQELADGQIEQLDEIRPVLAAVREAVKDYVRVRLAARSHASVERWKDEDIYPYEGDARDEIEAVEREVFDVVAVHVDRFLPKFKSAPKPVRRMQFSLLRRALESQPEEVAHLIDQFVGLPASERKILFDLLGRTTLSNIIRAAKLVDDRLQFLTGLEAMLGDEHLRLGFLEREHLHELVAKNTWIFGEAFSLTVSDESLTTVVRKHVEQANLDVIVDEPVRQSDGKTGRVDLMLTRALGAPAHSREHLIVELKRPTVPADEKIVAQTKKYARAIARDPRFLNTKTQWTFWAVTYALDEYATAEASQTDRPQGRIDVGPNFSVWLRTWGQVLEDCRSRMHFLRQALEVETKREAGVRHLQQSYTDAMPEIVTIERGNRTRLASVKKTRKAGAQAAGRPRGKLGPTDSAPGNREST